MRLFLDEQISPVVSSRLRGGGHDVVSPHDSGTRGLPDAWHFAWAVRSRRAVVTYNIDDFVLLANQAVGRGEDHFGLILVKDRRVPQRDVGAIIRALQTLLIAYPADDALLNHLVYLPGAARP